MLNMKIHFNFNWTKNTNKQKHAGNVNILKIHLKFKSTKIAMNIQIHFRYKYTDNEELKKNQVFKLYTLDIP